MLTYYYKFTDKFQCIYSLDMIRLNFEFYEKNDLSVFTNLLNKYNISTSCNIKRFFTKSGIGYKYLYNISFFQDDYECSFVIGSGLNSLVENNKRGFIEFNPNKCLILDIFNNFLNEFYDLCYKIDLVRYDLAIDLPISRSLIKMIRNFRCNYDYIVGDNYDMLELNHSLTEYQGQRNKNKFTKLYDKTKESKLDYDLSRIEFTFDKNECTFDNLPQFYIFADIGKKNHLDYSILNSKDVVIISLLKDCEDINFYLNKLNYRYRSKIMPFLNDLVYSPDLNLFNQIRELALSFSK